MQAASLRAAGRLSRTVRAAAALGALVGLAACGSFGNSSVQGAQPLACDDGLKAAFKPDANTSVVRVKAFRKGDPLTLENTVAAVAPATQVVAPADICLVKLLVRPGKAGPAGAPSTSAGIGIEVWLPPASTMDATQTAWNQIIRAYGSGGWAGGFHADATRLSSGATSTVNVNFVAHMGAVAQGYAVSTSDHGHGRPGNGSFARN